MPDGVLTITPHGVEIIVADSLGNAETFLDIDDAVVSVELWLRGGVLV